MKWEQWEWEWEWEGKTRCDAAGQFDGGKWRKLKRKEPPALRYTRANISSYPLRHLRIHPAHLFPDKSPPKTLPLHPLPRRSMSNKPSFFNNGIAVFISLSSCVFSALSTLRS